jgi:hypothetical protein
MFPTAKGAAAPASWRFPPSPLGKRSAYTHLALLLILASWGPVASGLWAFLNLCGHYPPAVIIEDGQVLSMAAAFVWLNMLVIRRTPHRPGKAGYRLAIRITALLVGGAGFAGSLPAANASSYGLISMISNSLLVLWLALEVCHRHGISPRALGILPRAGTLNRRPALQTAMIAMASMWLGLTLTGVLGQFVIMSRTGLPVMHTGQLTAAGLGTHTWLLLPAQVAQSVVVEDVVMVAATAALLGSARPWVIYTITGLLEVAGHAYFGIPAVGMLLYAYGRSWIYQRRHQLAVLMAIHFAWDTVPDLLQTLPLPARAAAIAVIVAIGAVWFMDGSRTRRTRTRTTSTPAAATSKAMSPVIPPGCADGQSASAGSTLDASAPPRT